MEALYADGVGVPWTDDANMVPGAVRGERSVVGDTASRVIEGVAKGAVWNEYISASDSWGECVRENAADSGRGDVRGDASTHSRRLISLAALLIERVDLRRRESRDASDISWPPAVEITASSNVSVGDRASPRAKYVEAEPLSTLMCERMDGARFTVFVVAITAEIASIQRTASQHYPSHLALTSFSRTVCA